MKYTGFEMFSILCYRYFKTIIFADRKLWRRSLFLNSGRKSRENYYWEPWIHDWIFLFKNSIAKFGFDKFYSILHEESFFAENFYFRGSKLEGKQKYFFYFLLYSKCILCLKKSVKLSNFNCYVTSCAVSL